MRLICSHCNLIAAQTNQGADGTSDITDPLLTCKKCNNAYVTPTVFDCARLTLLPELKTLLQTV